MYRKVRYRWCMARWGGGRDPGVQEGEIPVVYGTMEGGGDPGVQEGEIQVVYGTLGGGGSRCTGK